LTEATGGFDNNTMNTSFKNAFEIGNVTEIKVRAIICLRLWDIFAEGQAKVEPDTDYRQKINISAAVATFAGHGYCS
jgi:hypothetical protein